jgi:SOS response regulatory protein OraA/RecX
MEQPHTCQNNHKERNTMDLNNFAGILSVFSIVFSVMALFVGTAGAADPAPPACTGSGNSTDGNGHHLSPDAMIDMLEQRGVDISQVKTALQNGDTAAVKAWFDSYRQAHNDQFGTSTQQQQKLQTLITNLEQRGVDVSQVKTALQNNDTAAVKTWLESYRQENMEKRVNATRHQQGLQALVTHLEQKGVDVGQLKIALQNNDTAAVKAWFESSRQAHMDMIGNTTRQSGPEALITRLEQKGVDVSEVQTALQTGDTAAVKAWLDSHRQARNDSMPAGHHRWHFKANSTQ